jgi:hypothetical protein
LKDVEAAARAIGLQTQIHNANTNAEIYAAFETMRRERPDAVFLMNSALFRHQRPYRPDTRPHGAGQTRHFEVQKTVPRCAILPGQRFTARYQEGVRDLPTLTKPESLRSCEVSIWIINWPQALR